MANHSRGPWTVTKRFQDKIDIHHAEPTKIGASSLVVARVTCRDTWREEQEANARLIACAPELLEELSALVEFFKDTNYYEDHVFTDADRLIAKARGEAD